MDYLSFLDGVRQRVGPNNVLRHITRNRTPITPCKERDVMLSLIFRLIFGHQEEKTTHPSLDNNWSHNW